jgi:hypothetical protein
VDLANASRQIKEEEIGMRNPTVLILLRHHRPRCDSRHRESRKPGQRINPEQISDIYSGKISNWSEVGGEDRPIVRLSRETNSGTHVYFLETVLRLGNSEDKTLFSTDTLCFHPPKALLLKCGKIRMPLVTMVSVMCRMTSRRSPLQKKQAARMYCPRSQL